MRHPIDVLLEEHVAIRSRMADLSRAVRVLEARGDDAVPRCLPAFLAAGRMMETELPAHARREDEALFPVLERLFGGSGSPTEAMRAEHRAIHERADRFRAALGEVQDREHPLLKDGGATLRALAERQAGARELRATAREILDLLDLHFTKEEDILFPIAREILDAEAAAEVVRRMEELG